MDNVRNCDSYINIPSSRTYRCYLKYTSYYTYNVFNLRSLRSSLTERICWFTMILAMNRDNFSERD
jgi:hypothetical protein